MLAVLKKPRKQRLTKQKLYGHLPLIPEAIPDEKDIVGPSVEVRPNS